MPSGRTAIVCGLATGTVATIAPCAVSKKATRSAPYTPTSTVLPSGSMARPCGVAPTSTVCVTASRPVSMTLMLLEPSPLT